MCDKIEDFDEKHSCWGNRYWDTGDKDILNSFLESDEYSTDELIAHVRCEAEEWYNPYALYEIAQWYKDGSYFDESNEKYMKYCYLTVLAINGIDEALKSFKDVEEGYDAEDIVGSLRGSFSNTNFEKVEFNLPKFLEMIEKVPEDSLYFELAQEIAQNSERFFELSTRPDEVEFYSGVHKLVIEVEKIDKDKQMERYRRYMDAFYSILKKSSEGLHENVVYYQFSNAEIPHEIDKTPTKPIKLGLYEYIENMGDEIGNLPDHSWETVVNEVKAQFSPSVYDKISDESKKYLYTSLYSFFNLLEIGKKNFQDADFSGTVSLALRALELELKIRFCWGYLDYLKEQYSDIELFIDENDLGKRNLSRFRKCLFEYSEKDEGKKYKYKDYRGERLDDCGYTLGAVGFTMGRRKSKTFDATLLKYCKDSLLQGEMDDDILNEWLEDIYQKTESLRDKRNTASHGGEVLNVKDAQKVFGVLIGVQRLIDQLALFTKRIDLGANK